MENDSKNLIRNAKIQGKIDFFNKLINDPNVMEAEYLSRIPLTKYFHEEIERIKMMIKTAEQLEKVSQDIWHMFDDHSLDSNEIAAVLVNMISQVIKASPENDWRKIATDYETVMYHTFEQLFGRR